MPSPDLPGLDERLRRLPATLAVEPPAGLAERIARRGRRRRWRRRAAGMVAVAAMLAAGLATRAAVLDHTPTPVLDPGLFVQDATAQQLAAGQWQPLPAGPIAGRTGAAVAWTGRQLIVWGGSDKKFVKAFNNGAAYDPRTGGWQQLPPAPEGQTLVGNDGHDGTVWTGRELLIWGGYTPVDPQRHPRLFKPAGALAYDPARRAWRRLPPSPIPPPQLSSPLFWTGRELLVLGATWELATAGGGLQGVAYDPGANRWRRLAPSPQSPRLADRHLLDRTTVWAGSRLLVLNYWSRVARDPHIVSQTSMTVEPDGCEVWAYDPATDRWTTLPPPSSQVLALLAGASLVWNDRDVVAVANGNGIAVPPEPRPFAGRYDPDRARWTPIGTPRQPATSFTWTGGALVADTSDAYDPATDRWLQLPKPPKAAGPRPGWIGREQALLRWDSHDSGTIYRLVPAKR
ncbi:MAG TPA: hypothetical protein VGC06_27155 [Actinomycetes bacterium]